MSYFTKYLFELSYLYMVSGKEECGWHKLLLLVASGGGIKVKCLETCRHSYIGIIISKESLFLFESLSVHEHFSYQNVCRFPKQCFVQV